MAFYAKIIQQDDKIVYSGYNYIDQNKFDSMLHGLLQHSKSAVQITEQEYITATGLLPLVDRNHNPNP